MSCCVFLNDLGFVYLVGVLLPRSFVVLKVAQPRLLGSGVGFLKVSKHYETPRPWSADERSAAAGGPSHRAHLLEPAGCSADPGPLVVKHLHRQQAGLAGVFMCNVRPFRVDSIPLEQLNREMECHRAIQSLKVMGFGVLRSRPRAQDCSKKELVDESQEEAGWLTVSWR